MQKNKQRKSEFRLSLVQLGLIAAFCLGCVVASYLLGIYTGTRAGYETAVSSDLAASAKIPINLPPAKNDRPVSVSDVYARLDGNSPAAQVATTPGAKGTGGSTTELSAIPKVEVSPKPHDVEDLDREISDTLVDPEDTDPTRPISTPRPSEGDVWGAPGSAQPGTSNAAAHLTLGGVKEGAAERQPEPKAAEQHAKLTPSPVVPTPVAEKPKASPTPAEDKKEKEKAKALKEKEELEESAKAAVPRGWFAQVAAPKELKDAESVASKLKRSGFPVVIETAKVRGENYYRILVGPESSQDHANRLLGQLKREPYLEAEPFVKMVK